MRFLALTCAALMVVGSASAQVRATTVTEAGEALSGAPRFGSIVCDRRRP